MRAVVAGEGQFSNLSPWERSAAHTLIDREMKVRAAQERFGPAAKTDEHPAD